MSQSQQLAKINFSTVALKSLKPLPGFEAPQQRLQQQPHLQHRGYGTPILPAGPVDPFMGLGVGGAGETLCCHACACPPAPCCLPARLPAPLTPFVFAGAIYGGCWIDCPLCGPIR